RAGVHVEDSDRKLFRRQLVAMVISNREQFAVGRETTLDDRIEWAALDPAHEVAALGIPDSGSTFPKHGREQLRVGAERQGAADDRFAFGNVLGAKESQEFARFDIIQLQIAVRVFADDAPTVGREVQSAAAKSRGAETSDHAVGDRIAEGVGANG